VVKGARARAALGPRSFVNALVYPAFESRLNSPESGPTHLPGNDLLCIRGSASACVPVITVLKRFVRVETARSPDMTP